jgi:hypothetical protein
VAGRVCGPSLLRSTGGMIARPLLAIHDAYVRGANPWRMSRVPWNFGGGGDATRAPACQGQRPGEAPKRHRPPGTDPHRVTRDVTATSMNGSHCYGRGPVVRVDAEALTSAPRSARGNEAGGFLCRSLSSPRTDGASGVSAAVDHAMRVLTARHTQYLPLLSLYIPMMFVVGPRVLSRTH